MATIEHTATSSLTDPQRALIGPYVSDLESNVFAISGLPEEVIAVLFAYYSRSRDPLRVNLAKLLADQDLGLSATPSASARLTLAESKAREFHEKWVVGYGHASVAEHAVVHLALEQVSIVASKVIEDSRLAAFTEKSTRYVVFDQDSFYDLNRELPADLARDYQRRARELFSTYLDLQRQLSETLMQRNPRTEGQKERPYQAAIRAQACDLLRYLLPAGARTHIGMTINARALEHQLRGLYASPLAEIRDLAQAIQTQASAFVPTLLKYVAPTPHRRDVAKRLVDVLPQVNKSRTQACTEQPAGGEVRLLSYDDSALEKITDVIRYEHQRLSAAELQASKLENTQRLKIWDAYLADRDKYDQPLRALEHAHYLFEIVLDEGAFRDLQRHRLQTQTKQLLGFDLGYELPPAASELGIEQPMRQAIERAYDTWSKLTRHSPWLAQYIVPLAARRSYLLSCNLRELFHMVELRSARQGHWSYRTIAQKLAQALEAVHPWAAAKMRVDWQTYALTRPA